MSQGAMARFTVGLLATMAVLTGCGRDVPPAFVLNESVRELPKAHQQSIAEILADYFGSPQNPRLMLPTGEFDDDGKAQLEDHYDPSWLKTGSAVYERRCAGCHGTTGDGNGEAAAYLNPKPRDYRLGVFKFTSTPYGFRPRRQDLIRTIRRGAKGTSMPAFRWLPNEELQPLVDYVIFLSYRGQLEGSLARELEVYEEDEELEPGLAEEFVQQIHESWQRSDGRVVLPDTPPPPYDEESIELGRQIFTSKDNECSKCHGLDGRGQTEWLSPRFVAQQEELPPDKRIQLNRDAWGNVAPAADLTAGMLHGGRRPIDVYRRIYSGINGTPMPAFANKFPGEDRVKIWHLAHFVISLTEGREFQQADESGSGSGSSSD